MDSTPRTIAEDFQISRPRRGSISQMNILEPLFVRLRSEIEWDPSSYPSDLTKVDFEILLYLTDNWFDKLYVQGFFFHDYNDVLARIEDLKKYLKEQKEKTE